VAETAAPQRTAETDARLASVYELYASSLRARCLRLTGDPVAADDLAQEVFTRFLARVPRPPSGMNVHGYLLAMAHNVWVNQIRAERAFPLEEIDDARTADDRIENDPVRSLLLDEQQALVRRGAAGLPGRQRRALTLRELEGRSYAEIGAELGLGTNAVAQVVWRARGQLRRALRRFQVDPERLPETCRALLDDMSDLLDSREGRGTPALETHLAGCRSCRRTLASYQEAGSRLRGAFPLLPLAAMLARAAGTLRACVEAPAAIGTAATVTAAVVAVGGGGGALLVSHTLNPSAAARAATPAVHRSNPPTVSQIPLPAPSTRSLTVVHARRTASAGGARIVTRAPRATRPAGSTHGPAAGRALVKPAPAPTSPAPPTLAPEAVPAQDPATVPAVDPGVVPANEPALVAAPPEPGSTHPEVVKDSASIGDDSAKTRPEKAAKTPSPERATVAGTSSGPSVALPEKRSEKTAKAQAAKTQHGSTGEAPAPPAMSEDAAATPMPQAPPGSPAPKPGKTKDTDVVAETSQASPAVAPLSAPAPSAPLPVAADLQAPAVAPPSEGPAPPAEPPAAAATAEAASVETPDAGGGRHGGAGQHLSHP
jgi:RNA polymerase sigma factor (sigma-70 family)